MADAGEGTGVSRVETVLVAVDGGEATAEATSFAIPIAARYDAELALLYVHARETYRAVETGEEDAEALSETAVSFLSGLTNEAEAAGLSVRTATAYGFSPRRKTVHPGTVVLDAADELGADFLVIPRERVAEAPGQTLAKVAGFALAYASQPVLAV